MSKLEKFIQDNREEFDSEEPRDELWQNITRELKPEVKITKGKSGFNFWKIAAIILLLVSFTLVLDKYYLQKGTESISAESYLTNEFQEAESFYLNLVSEKKEALEQQFKNDPELKREFLSEVEGLDQQYNQLKSDLKLGNQDEILDAMIINLQLRIEILNRQLEILENLNEKERENEDINI